MQITTNKINSAEDLRNIKGFGDSIISNVEKENGITKEKVNKKSDDMKKEMKKENLTQKK